MDVRKFSDAVHEAAANFEKLGEEGPFVIVMHPATNKRLDRLLQKEGFPACSIAEDPEREEDGSWPVVNDENVPREHVYILTKKSYEDAKQASGDLTLYFHEGGEA